ncbi:AAA family ATPase [Chondromyces apiculatus]|uniref:Putative ATP/GTP-binding protein n=1 Tax=Chondromyces apiculatus DSM 436 TaxID=1192034 RepID=A0A017T886_9BACT|nr:ATP-binding protein [Chondromyces apiculatus]EYF05010.1 Putative ATP/GTP-binding protein [Chondromyces apiculatus DSM 436]
MPVSDDVVATLLRHPEPGTVCMLCGVAGSGKTTLATRLEARGYTRLSKDEEIWERFGRYGIDYDPAAYPALQEAADARLHARLVALLTARAPVVLDYSFWQRADREATKALIEAHGCRWVLLVLQVDPDTLRARLRVRSQRFDANAAFPITEALLTRYLDGFERPEGEGEHVLVASDAWLQALGC